jgi:hypothetical protein
MVAMSNNNQDYDDDYDFEDYEDSPQRGDDVLTKVRRAERKASKRVKELESELESLRKFQRTNIIEKVLTEKGANPKIAAFIPADIEMNPDAISGWLEQYGDLFGVAKQQQMEQSSVSQEDLATLRQIDSATSGAISPDGVNDSFSSIINAQSKEELLDFLFSQGLE